MYLNKKFEDLTISDDFLFGIIMRNPKYCKPFLETILNVRISRIEYPEGQKTINLSLDATQKIFLNTKGIFDDVRPELKRLLNFIDGKQPEDAFTQKLSEAVESAKRNEKWRLDYMNLQMAYDEKYQEGLEAGMTESAKRMLSAGKYADTEISEITGLSLEQIQQLKESSIKAPSSVS